MVRLVRAAERERPPLVRLADRWALWFLLVTLVLGGGAWWFAGDATRALAVLVVATPCPLILAAPVALICGVSRAARRGIIVKGPGVLERLAHARTVLFDKTGTLTTGTPRVTGVETLDGFDPDDVLRCAGSLAQVSQHAVAGAIVLSARGLELKLTLPRDAEEIRRGRPGRHGGRQTRDWSAPPDCWTRRAFRPPPTAAPPGWPRRPRPPPGSRSTAASSGALLLADRIRR